MSPAAPKQNTANERESQGGEASKHSEDIDQTAQRETEEQEIKADETEFSAQPHETGSDEAAGLAEQTTQAVLEQAEADEQAGVATDTVEAKLLDSGYGITYHNGFCHVCYAVKIENPSQEYAIKNVYVDVTCRAGDGRVLKSDDLRIPFIAAGDTIYMAYDRISWKGEEADSVDISIRHDPDSKLLQEDSRVLYMKDFEISNVSVMEEEEGCRKYAGEVTNNSGYDLWDATLVIVYRKNGKLAGGRQDRIKDIRSGATRSFDSSRLYQFDDYDEYEIYAVPESRGSSPT